MVASRCTVTKVAFNNGGVNKSLTPINDGTSPAPVSGLHDMGDVILAFKYSFQTNYVCTIMLFLILNYLHSFMNYRKPVI